MKPRRIMGTVRRLMLHPAGILVTGMTAILISGQPCQAEELQQAAPVKRKIEPAQPVRSSQPTLRKVLEPAPAGPLAVPMIRGTSPVRSLERDGRSQAVTLSGTNLHLITTAKVVRNGLAAPGVSARIGPPAPSSREVIFTALPNASPGEYEVVFLAGAKRVEWAPVSAGDLLAEFMKLNVVDVGKDPETLNALHEAMKKARQESHGEREEDPDDEGE